MRMEYKIKEAESTAGDAALQDESIGHWFLVSYHQDLSKSFPVMVAEGNKEELVMIEAGGCYVDAKNVYVVCALKVTAQMERIT